MRSRLGTPPANSPTRRLAAPRRGFTIIELMVVVIIVGLLAALLLSALGGATRTARLARVQNEIHLLETALTQFHNRYGVYPPSRIILHEDPASNPYQMPTTPADIHEAVEQRTIQFFQRLWAEFAVLNPQFDFDGDGIIDQVGVDFNGDGDFLDEVELNGSECLVFFLGGMPLPLVRDPATGNEDLLGITPIDTNGDGTVDFRDVTTRGIDGFGRDPTFPFSRSGTPVPRADQRFAPLFEFKPERLTDVDADGFWEYYDPNQEPPDASGTFDPANMPHPYAYFSGYEGQGYNSIQIGTTIFVTFDNAWPTAAPGLLYPLSRNVAAPSLVQWWNPNSYQIISPGVDGLIGQSVHPFLSDGVDNNGDGTADGPDEAFSVFNPDDPAYDIKNFLSPEMHDNLTNFVGTELQEAE